MSILRSLVRLVASNCQARRATPSRLVLLPSELVKPGGYAMTQRNLTMNTEQMQVEHDPVKQEFYIKLGNMRAVLNYRSVRPGVVDLYHTEVPEKLQGQGIAKRLAERAFTHVVDSNLNMRVTCTYLQKYLKENPREEFKSRVIK